MLIAQPLSTASLAAYARINYHKMSIGNSMICSDIWHNYHKSYLCQIWRTNHAIICLYYYPRKVCNFHMQVFQIKLKYHCS